MFNTISWQSYWTMLAISLAVYYFFIVFIYYRKELKAAFFTKTFKGNANQSFTINEDEFKAPDKDSEEGIVYSCMDELNAFFEEAKKRKWNKKEMIYALQGIMKKYPSIKTSGYKQSVSNVLLNQCEHICSIHLNAEELNHVWLG
jgi:hypothetical protein